MGVYRGDNMEKINNKAEYCLKVSDAPCRKLKRNGRIDLYKFIFAICVIMFHFSVSFNEVDGYFLRGYIAVEFFFAVSGFLFAKSLENYNASGSVAKASLKFMFKKYKVIMPYHLYAIAVTFVFTVIHYSWDVKEIVFNLIRDLPNIFLLQMGGINSMEFTMNEWYISAMLIVMFILTPLLIKFYRAFIYYIAPIVALFSYGFLFNTFGTVNKVQEWTGFSYAALIRAFGGIALGCFCYAVWSLGIFEKLNRLALWGIELLCLVIILLYANDYFKERLDIPALLLISAVVIIAFTPKADISFLNNKFIYFLGKLSLVIYLNHNYIRFILVDLNFDLSYKRLALLYVILVFAASLLCLGVCTAVKKLTVNVKSVKQ